MNCVHFRTKDITPNGGLRQVELLADFADLFGVAGWMKGDDDGELLGGGGADNGVEKREGAEIEIALFEVGHGARAALLEMIERVGERGEAALRLSLLGRLEFPRAIGGHAKNHFFAGAVARGSGGNHLRGEASEERVFDEDDVLDAIEDGPAAGRGANFCLLVGDPGSSGTQRFLRIVEQLQNLCAVGSFHWIQTPRALRSFSSVVARSSGSTRVSPTTVMKLASPAQRGRTWRCR